MEQICFYHNRFAPVLYRYILSTVYKEIRFSSDSLAIYENNVQAYRGLFLSSQSLMLAVGAIVIDKNFILTIIVSVIALLQIWVIWFKVIRVRTIIVDFYKFKMYKYFNSNGDLIKLKKKNKKPLTENIYVQNAQIRKIVNGQMNRLLNQKENFRNIRFTRLKIDVVIPCSISIIWIVFIFYSFINFLMAS